MSWFKKAAIGIKEAQKSYLDIGHESGIIILWAHDGNQLKTKQLEEDQGHYRTHATEGIHFGREKTVATGRIDVQNAVGSISPGLMGNLDSRKLKRAINDLIAEFPGIKFTVYTEVGGGPVQSLSDFYQTL